MSITGFFCTLNRRFHRLAVKVESPLLLAIRLWVGNIFFQSGYNKLSDYLSGNGDTVTYLFAHIHPVPFIPAEIAAPLGTGGELILGICFIAGFMSHFAAAGLLVITAIIQYTQPNLSDHALWGLLIAVIMVRGGGLFSFDQLIPRLLFKRHQG